MNEEIIAGIRNAVENGSSLEQAGKSFINAGYNPSEVHQALSALSSGSYQPSYQAPPADANVPSPDSDVPQTNHVSQPVSQPVSNEVSFSSQPQPKKSKKWLWILSIILVLLLILLGFVFFLGDFLFSIL